MLRLTEDTHNALRDLGQSTGIPTATLGALAVQALLDYAEAHHGRLIFPLSFDPDPPTGADS